MQHSSLTADRGVFVPLIIACIAGLATFLLSTSTRNLIAAGISMTAVPAMALLLVLAARFVPPTVPLFLAVVFLESPFPALLDNRPSAYITTALLGWAGLGVFISVSRPAVAGSNPLLPKVRLLALYGLFGALLGLWSGNLSEYVVGDLFQVEEFTVVFILVSCVISDQKTLRRLLLCAFGSTLLTSVFQLALYAAGFDPSQFMPSSEGASALARTINLSAIFPFVALLSIYPSMRTTRQRFGIILALAPLVANLVLSLTRGVWLACFVGLIVCAFLLQPNERLRLLKSLAFGSVILMVLSACWSFERDAAGSSVLNVVKDRLLFAVIQVQQGVEGTTAVQTRRFVEITNIAPQIIAAPLFGHGLGAFYSIDANAMVAEADLGNVDYHYMHNLYLLVGFRLGLVGLATLLWVLHSYFRDAGRSCFRMPPGPYRALAAGLIAGVAAQVSLSMSSPTILNHPSAGLIACVMAITFRLQQCRAPAAT